LTTRGLYATVKSMKNLRRSDAYKKWFKSLRDTITKARILARIKRLAAGNPGDHRFLGDISELRFDFGPGYRIYYMDTGTEIIILLLGVDKSSQQGDIARAREIAGDYAAEEGKQL